MVLYRNGNFIALMNLCANGGEEADGEALAKLANEEYKKIDGVWSGLFGSVPDNEVVIPEKTSFDMTDGENELDDGIPFIGG